MSDESEKHFAPTPTRLARAKREGNVARSQDVTATASFAAATLATIGVVPLLGCVAREAIARHDARDALAIVALAFVPAIAAAAGAAVVGVAQTGGLSLVGPSLKFERIDPVAGFKRICSRETAIQIVQALTALGVATVAVVPALFQTFAAGANGASPQAVAAVAWAGALHVAFAAAAVGGVFAIADFAVVRARWLRNLRMSLHELKRELRENDGDPHARSRRTSLHRALVRGSIERVKEAAFVVVNPSHIAIALAYRPPEIPIPRVLVRASDDGALRVRAAAERHGIPVIENVPLARALFATLQPGDAIAADQYVAVAEIVAALVRAGVV